MVSNKTNASKKKLEDFIQLLGSFRQLQQDILNHGLDAADIYVDDVDGDWLDNWDEEEEDLETKALENLAGEKFEKATFGFLNSDDPVAVKVRQRLKEKSLVEIAAKLEKVMMFEEGYARLFAVKELLGGSVSGGSITRGDADRNDEEIEVLELAEDLLEKLVEIGEFS